MFTRIMSIVLAVILLMTTVLSVFGWVVLRDQQTEQAMETLRAEAREIAYLASRRREASPFGLFSVRDKDQNYLQWKANAVYEKYGAYILVVDRSGRMMDNMNVTYADNPDFAATLNEKDIMRGLGRVLKGEEIDLNVTVGGSAYFTVGVPFMQSGMVLGAVFMQTPAQVVENVGAELIAPVAGIAAAACVVAGLLVFVCLRGVLKPLGRLTDAARAMADGDFAVRVPETKSTREVAELSNAFNTMVDELSQVEDSRREFVANVSH